MEIADAALVERTLSGDLEGFGELHRRYYGKVVSLVSGILRDRARAEDLVQDAYVSALRDLAQLKERDHFYPWLRRIAVNRALDEKRRWSRHEERELPKTLYDDSPPEEERLLRNEFREAVRLALDKLPEGQRAAVILRFFDELPMRTVAAALGCEEVTARTQVFRGLRRLGIFLKARKARTPESRG
jgi:RNA polymerase sigma-70 factor (ECF subfamily)